MFTEVMEYCKISRVGQLFADGADAELGSVSDLKDKLATHICIHTDLCE